MKKTFFKPITILLIIYDYVVICVAYFLALLFRFDFLYSKIEKHYLSGYLKSIFIYAAFSLILAVAFKLYKSVWKFAGYREVARILATSILGTCIYAVFTNILVLRMPVSYYLFGSILHLLFACFARLAYRLRAVLKAISNNKGNNKRIMIIGGGVAASLIIRENTVTSNEYGKIVCIIDDDEKKLNREILGVPVVGNRDCILSAARDYKIDEIVFAIPSANKETRTELMNLCAETSCVLKVSPSMKELEEGRTQMKQMKDVSVEDLLGREPIKTDLKEVFDFIQGKTVLVTGGGGSIGSELCRQIAAHNPKRLIIFDVYENNAYDIQFELRERFPYLKLETLIGSVRDSRRLTQIFKTYKPDIVYHAAAHKHVPLMEDSPCESIKNNAIGTYKTAYAAMINGCKRFVLISTDKAVNPTNIMGASKRLCEMIIQTFNEKISEGKPEEIPNLFTHEEDSVNSEIIFPEKIETEFVAVRFGNVLGSNGSVVPIFKRQIAKGGPVTVTHPDIIRYFMTIPEAVSLVLQAGTNAKGGEIFVLDMGSPVKIDTLARNIIKLSGLKPDVDIKIEYTGLRPGEKLYEEKLMAEEGLRKTENDLIHIGAPIPFDTDAFIAKLGDLMEAAYDNDENIKAKVKEVVTTYTGD